MIAGRRHHKHTVSLQCYRTNQKNKLFHKCHYSYFICNMFYQCYLEEPEEANKIMILSFLKMKAKKSLSLPARIVVWQLSNIIGKQNNEILCSLSICAKCEYEFHF